MDWSGGLVDAIQFSYREKGTEIEKYAAAKHGGGGALKFDHQMQAGDYIIALVARHGTEIDSIEVHTNRGPYQRVGGNGGDSDYAFEGRPADGLNEIVGIFGDAGHHLDQLGVYIRTRTE